MTTSQPLRPAQRRQTSREKFERQLRSVHLAYGRTLLKKTYRELGEAHWFQRQLFRQLDARILAHGGRKGAGITRPRERREGDPPYRDETDAAERRWLEIPQEDAPRS